MRLGDIIEYQTEAILGWMSCFLALLLTIKLKYYGCQPNLNRKPSVSLTAAVKWDIALISARDRFIESSTEVEIPYGLILTGVGGLVAEILFALTTIEACRVFHEREPVQSSHVLASSTVGQSYTVP